MPDLDDVLIDKIVSQLDEQSGHLSIQQMEHIRDCNLVGILKVLKPSLGRWTGVKGLMINALTKQVMAPLKSFL